MSKRVIRLGLILAFVIQSISSKSVENSKLQIDVVDSQNCASERKARAGDKLTVHYEGFLQDGMEKFDSSYGHEPFTFTLGAGQVIAGWDQGLLNVCKGDEINLVIPGHLGYGEKGAEDVIPPNATLLFNIVVVDIQRKAPEDTRTKLEREMDEEKKRREEEEEVRRLDAIKVKEKEEESMRLFEVARLEELARREEESKRRREQQQLVADDLKARDEELERRRVQAKLVADELDRRREQEKLVADELIAREEELKRRGQQKQEVAVDVKAREEELVRREEELFRRELEIARRAENLQRRNCG